MLGFYLPELSKEIEDFDSDTNNKYYDFQFVESLAMNLLPALREQHDSIWR